MARLKGLNSAIKQLQQLPGKVNKAKRIGEKRVADLMAEDARRLAPEDKGLLIAGIDSVQTETSTKVVSEAGYSAYQEFGTGPLTQVPAGLEEYAAEFIVNKKGNTPAQPFFFPAIFKHKDEVVVEVQKELEKIL